MTTQVANEITDTQATDHESPERKLTRLATLKWSCGTLAVGLIVVLVHIVPAHGWGIGFGGVLWGLGATAGGFFGGFLFGIPRILQSETAVADGHPGGERKPTTYNVQINTNLEQISDWLTKIIVGLGLVQLNKLPKYVTDSAEYVSGTFDVANPKANAPFACAMLVYFCVAGFAVGYVITRLLLTGAFAAADRAVLSPQERFGEHVKEIARAVSASDDGPDDRPPGGVTKAQVAASNRLGQLAIDVGEPVIRQQVEDLAREYERVVTLPDGIERTDRLDGIVVRMRTLGRAAAFMLPDLMKSKSPGMRLGAIAILSVLPDSRYLDWLVERFTPDVERPFVLAQTAVALEAASSKLDVAELKPRLARARGLLGNSPADVQKKLENADAIVTTRSTSRV